VRFYQSQAENVTLRNRTRYSIAFRNVKIKDHERSPDIVVPYTSHTTQMAYIYMQNEAIYATVFI